MKNLYKLTAILLFAGLTLASCKSGNDNGTPSKNQPVTETSEDSTDVQVGATEVAEPLIAGKYQFHEKRYIADYDYTIDLDHIIEIDNARKWTAKISFLESVAEISGFVNDKNELVVEKYLIMGDGDGEYDNEMKGHVLGTVGNDEIHGPYDSDLVPFEDDFILKKAI